MAALSEQITDVHANWGARGDLLHDANTLFWDLDREVIIFGKLD